MQLFVTSVPQSMPPLLNGSGIQLRQPLQRSFYALQHRLCSGLTHKVLNAHPRLLILVPQPTEGRENRMFSAKCVTMTAHDVGCPTSSLIIAEERRSCDGGRGSPVALIGYTNTATTREMKLPQTMPLMRETMTSKSPAKACVAVSQSHKTLVVQAGWMLRTPCNHSMRAGNAKGPKQTGCP